MYEANRKIDEALEKVDRLKEELKEAEEEAQALLEAFFEVDADVPDEEEPPPSEESPPTEESIPDKVLRGFNRGDSLPKIYADIKGRVDTLPEVRRFFREHTSRFDSEVREKLQRMGWSDNWKKDLKVFHRDSPECEIKDDPGPLRGKPAKGDSNCTETAARLYGGDVGVLEIARVIYGGNSGDRERGNLRKLFAYALKTGLMPEEEHERVQAELSPKHWEDLKRREEKAKKREGKVKKSASVPRYRSRETHGDVLSLVN
jgi:hypothetical protein